MWVTWQRKRVEEGKDVDDVECVKMWTCDNVLRVFLSFGIRHKKHCHVGCYLREDKRDVLMEERQP